MKTLQIVAPGKTELREVPIPAVGPNQVLMRVEAVTTCPRWDIHARHNIDMFEGGAFVYPLAAGRPGHEAAGTVAALGETVTGLAIGDRICAWRDTGQADAGCYSQYVALPAAAVLPVPDSLSLHSVVSLELAMCLGTSFLRLKRFDAIRGRRFGVMGLGPAGLVAIQMARAEGAAQVIGFDLSEKRRAFAGPLIDAALDPRADNAGYPARPAELGLDTTIDCVGAKASVEWAMDHTREVVALFGVQHESYTFAVRHYVNLCLFGYPPHSIEAARYALGLVEKGDLNLELLATHRLPLSQYDIGIDLLESQEAIKVCFDPWA